MLALDPRVTRRPITVAEFLRMGEVGILSPRDRVELIEGALIAMTPNGANHAGTVIALTDSLTTAIRGRALVSPQNPATSAIVACRGPVTPCWILDRTVIELPIPVRTRLCCSSKWPTAAWITTGTEARFMHGTASVNCGSLAWSIGMSRFAGLRDRTATPR
jgi:hypothetical protein